MKNPSYVPNPQASSDAAIMIHSHTNVVRSPAICSGKYLGKAELFTGMRVPFLSETRRRTFQNRISRHFINPKHASERYIETAFGDGS